MEPSREPTILDTVLLGLVKVNSLLELRHFVNATYMQLNLSGKGRRKLLAAVRARAGELGVDMKTVNTTVSDVYLGPNQREQLLDEKQKVLSEISNRTEAQLDQGHLHT